MISLHISLAAEKIFQIGPLSITNAMLTSVVASFVIVILFGLAGATVKMLPSGRLSQVAEVISESLLDMIEQVTNNRKKARMFFPLLMTLFSFILFNNWLGLLPGVGSIMVHTSEGAIPLFRGANADLNTTLALAILSVVITQIYSIKSLGLFKHLGKYFSLNPILMSVGLLELVSEFSKMISFSFRLFGNIFAGEVLLLVISSLVPIVGPLPFYGLELFVGFIQALVFTMLTLVFLEIGTTDHTSHNEAHASHNHSPAPSVEMATSET